MREHQLRRATGLVGTKCVVAVISVVFTIGVAEPHLPGQDTPAGEPAANNPPSSSPDVSLDSLLDLADKAPEQLQSIGVHDNTNNVRTTAENLFDVESSIAPSSSTGGLLSQAAGVVIRSTSALNQDARIRGYSGSQLVGVAEGMNQSKTRLDIDSLFSQIDPNLVDSITVTPGPYSVLFGPGFAFFDARLISTRRSDDLQLHSDSFVGYNTNGQQFAWRETAGISASNMGAIVSYGQRFGDAYHPGDRSNDFLVPADYDSQDVFVALSRDISPYSRVDLFYIHQQLENALLPGVAYDINDQGADQFNLRWTVLDDYLQDQLVLQFWWNQATYDADSARFSKQQTFASRLLGEPYPELSNGGVMTGQGLSDNWGGRVVTYWGDSESLRVHAGGDWRRVRQFYRERDFDPLGNPALLADTFGIPDSSSDDAGAFIGGTIPLTDQWSVGVGQRVDWVFYGLDQGDEVVTSTQFTPNGEFFAGVSTETRTLSTTYLSSTYAWSEQVTFQSGIAYAMRPPNLTELYSDQPFAPLVRFGNSFAFGSADLEAERNLQFDLGFTTQFEQSTFGARAFHSTIYDYIGLASSNYGTFPQLGTVPTGTLNRGRPFMVDPNIPNQDVSADAASIGYVYRNLDRTTLYGFDVLGTRQLVPWLELTGSATYTRGTNHDPSWIDVYTGDVNSLGGDEGLPGIYPLNGSCSIRLLEPLDRLWTLEWQSRYTARQDFLANSLGELGTPGFAVHNIHASYRLSESTSVRSSLLNVFDRTYYEHNSLAVVDRSGNISFVKNPGISWFLSVTVNL